MFLDIAFWNGRTHDLGRMSLAGLMKVFFTYPAVIVYAVLAAVSGGLAIVLADAVWAPLLAAVMAGFVYPLVWYVLHRFVLHGRFLYKSRFTASVWKRIHFDHHQDPHDLKVLFGALYTTLPTVALVTLPLGWLIGGTASASAAFAGGLVATCFYEFCHCVEHLNHVPKWAFLRRIKRLHLAHHFHNETGNFGITNFMWDRLFGTLYGKPKDVPRSPTVFDLGYTTVEAERYPWVAQLSDDMGNTIDPGAGRARMVQNSGVAAMAQEAGASHNLG